MAYVGTTNCYSWNFQDDISSLNCVFNNSNLHADDTAAIYDYRDP